VKAALLPDYHAPLEIVERADPEPTGRSNLVVRIGVLAARPTCMRSMA
jgi:hypothetical protein